MMFPMGNEKGVKTNADSTVDTKMDTNFLGADDPALLRVVAAWPSLTEAMRRALLALLAAADAVRE
jgi:hypothetical protein